MHLTTLVSLLAAGAAAVPAPKFTDLSTKVARPSLLARKDAASPSSVLGGLPKPAEITKLARRQEEEEEEESSSSSSASGIIGDLPEIPGLPKARRQAAEPTGVPAGQPSFREFTEEQDRKAAAEPKDPLDAYLETFTADGDYDEADQDAKLEAYIDSFKPKPKTNETAPSTHPEESEDELDDFSFDDEEVEEPKAPTKATSEEPAAPAAPKNETSEDALKTDELPTHGLFDFKKLMGSAKEDEEPKPSNATAAAPKNETSDEALKTDELPTHEIFKNFDFKKLMGGESKEKNETAIPAKNETEPVAPKNETEAATPKNETAPAADSSSPTDKLSGLLGALPVGGLPVKRQAEDEKSAAPADDTKKVTTNTTSSAQPSGTASDGYYGINKHLSKLDKLPIGGLPIKREAFEEGDRFDSRFSQPEGVAQPSGVPVAHDQGFAAPSGFAPAQPQGVAQPTGHPAQPSEAFRGADRTDARMSRTNKPVFKTDAPAKPEGKKPAGGSPLDGLLVPLQRKQDIPAAAPSSAPSKPSHAAAAPTGGAPEEKPEEKSEESSPFAALFGKKPEGAEKNATKPETEPKSEKPESEDESPLASLFGMKPETPEKNATKPESEPAAKPESEDEEKSPLAGLMGKKPEAPTESKSEAPSPSASKSEDAPAESSSAPASPLAGLMGRAITEQHEEFSPEMVKPSSSEGGEPTEDSEPSVEEILADFA